MVLGRWPRRTSFARSSCGTLRTRPRTWRSRTCLTYSAKMCVCACWGIRWFALWDVRRVLWRWQIHQLKQHHQYFYSFKQDVHTSKPHLPQEFRMCFQQCTQICAATCRPLTPPSPWNMPWLVGSVLPLQSLVKPCVCTKQQLGGEGNPSEYGAIVHNMDS